VDASDDAPMGDDTGAGGAAGSGGAAGGGGNGGSGNDAAADATDGGGTGGADGGDAGASDGGAKDSGGDVSAACSTAWQSGHSYAMNDTVGARCNDSANGANHCTVGNTYVWTCLVAPLCGVYGPGEAGSFAVWQPIAPCD
jgi:hypothetical protein